MAWHGMAWHGNAFTVVKTSCHAPVSAARIFAPLPGSALARSRAAFSCASSAATTSSLGSFFVAAARRRTAVDSARSAAYACRRTALARRGAAARRPEHAAASAARTASFICLLRGLADAAWLPPNQTKVSPNVLLGRPNAGRDR